jgi:hypothetical protein
MKERIYITIIIFLFSFNIVLGQCTLMDSVVQKLSKDKRAFKNFSALGELYTIDKLVQNSDVFFQCFATLYNTFDPFCRLVDSDSLKAFYNTIINLSELDYKNNKQTQYDKKKSFYNEKLHQIRKKWGSKKRIKKLYLDFINSKNYRKDFEKEELDGYMRLYLKSYFIVVDSK